MSKKLAKVLFVEDSKNEFILNMMILRREKVNVQMDHVRDGVEALDYLKFQGKYVDHENRLPDLILLDQRLITMDGDELLKNIKQDDALKNIPVVMFSGLIKSEQENEIMKLGAVASYDKPINYDKLQDICDSVEGLRFENENEIRYLCVK